MFKLFGKKDKKSININISIPSIKDDNSDIMDKYINEQKKSGNPKFNRTAKEKELSGLFAIEYGSRCREYNKALNIEVNHVFKIEDAAERIKQCNKAISLYEEYKTFCYSKGEGGKIHFDDAWEHCHNSRNKDFRFIEKVENELNKLISNA